MDTLEKSAFNYVDNRPESDGFYDAFIAGAKWKEKVFTGTHFIDEWSGLFDKNGKTLFEGDEVLIFGQKAKIVFELGAFCYQYDAGLLGIQTTPINGSNITIDSDFKCLDVEKIL